MDLDSLAAETYRYIEAAHEAHWMEQPTRFLRSIATAGERVVRIGKIARSLSGEVEALPDVDPNQLEVWRREDGAVVAPTGTAA